MARALKKPIIKSASITVTGKTFKIVDVYKNLLFPFDIPKLNSKVLFPMTTLATANRPLVTDLLVESSMHF